MEHNLKILYINNIGSPFDAAYGDFLCDSVFHGFRSLYGNNVIDYPKFIPVYDTVNEDILKKTYGGFTLYKTLPDIEVDRTDIDKKIETNFFDLIIYGHATRSLYKIEKVLQYYNRNKIILLDGEDEEDVARLNLYPVMRGNAQKIAALNCVTFKRELNKNINPTYLPISFSVPKNKFITHNVVKTQDLAQETTTAPGGKRFNTEKEYYEEYQRSYFGITQKKAGWDCLRHYEIVSNKCIPYFRDIYGIPDTIMTTFPKQLVQKAMHLITNNPIDNSLYFEKMQEIFDYTLNNCNTEATAKYILKCVL